MRQGGDVGTQYHSAIYAIGDRQLEPAEQSKAAYQRALADAGRGGPITTEVEPAPEFFYAEDLSPAIPGEKSRRLLWIRRNRNHLSVAPERAT